MVSWQVVFHSAAEQELQRLVPAERVAVLHAVEKLQALGPHLPYPHQSTIKGTADLRELRPRSGRSPWRALYAGSGQQFIVLAIAPEADMDSRSFGRGIRSAERRLADANK